MHFNREQYLAWQKKINSNKTFRAVLEFFGIYSVIIFAAVTVYLLARHPSVLLADAAAFIVARLFLVSIIDYYYKKPRPYQKFGFLPITSKLMSRLDANPDSFPSQHVISLAAISVAFWHFSAVLALAGLILTVLVGIARVMLGYHYPADVVGGLLLGIAVAGVTLSFTKY